MVLYEFNDFQRNMYNVVDFCIIWYISYDFGVNHMFLHDFDKVWLIFDNISWFVLKLCVVGDICNKTYKNMKIIKNSEELEKKVKKVKKKLTIIQKTLTK